jgi:hypothetical protein
MVNSKHSFWIAFVFTIIIFSLGLIFGYFIEHNRSDSVEFSLMRSEITLTDEQIRNDQIFNSEVSCEIAEKNTFEFADRIYNEAVKLEEYDSRSTFGRVLKTVHKRYDLMRVMLYNEGKYLREECNSSIHVVVYFFSYDEQDVDVRAQQTAYARVLTDLKEEFHSEILLVPIAGNLELSSVDLIMDEYNITKMPSILIDDGIVVDDINELSNIENIVFDSNKE